MKTLLNRVKTFITAAGLDTGYTWRFHTWTDADSAGKVPTIFLRGDGAGQSNAVIQQNDVLIQLIGNPQAVEAMDTRMEAILALFRGTTTTSGVIRFDPLSNVRGPFYLENGRPVFQLSVRCITEDS